MFSLNEMPSTTTVFSAYTSVAASAMIVRTITNEARSIANQLIPQQVQRKIFSTLGRFFGSNLSSKLTFIIDQQDGIVTNQIYEAAEIYLRTKINPSIGRLRVSKTPREKNFSLTIEKGEEIIDVYDGRIQLKWKFKLIEPQRSGHDNAPTPYSSGSGERRFFELTFHKRHKEEVLGFYLPHVMKESKAIKEKNKVLKLFALGGINGNRVGRGGGESIILDHPATFDKLAMDSEIKKELMDDLDRFVKRREFYRRVGKAWKRGYLLYGPPGTGKSTLIAAMANYLNFNIYDLELASVFSNSELRKILLATENRSILVIEDIDCSVELPDRTAVPKPGVQPSTQKNNALTLSGLLNCIDGLWSSCGDERIIVFTTNHRDRLDPALLRPGRMDMHIHMSYCTPCGFRLLASNYLGIEKHRLFGEIEGLIKEKNITPAEVAEEMMKSYDAEIVLEGLINFLKSKKIESNVEDGKDVDDRGAKRRKIECKDEKKVKSKNRTPRRSTRAKKMKR